jgi:hypothetical protein
VRKIKVVIKCRKGGEKEGNQWLISSLKMKAACFSETSHPHPAHLFIPRRAQYKG